MLGGWDSGRGPAGAGTSARRFSDISRLPAALVDPRRETLSSTTEPKELIRQTDVVGETQGRIKGSAAFSTTARQNVIATLKGIVSTLRPFRAFVKGENLQSSNTKEQAQLQVQLITTLPSQGDSGSNKSHRPRQPGQSSDYDSPRMHRMLERLRANHREIRFCRSQMKGNIGDR